MTKPRTERYLTLSGIHDFVLFKTAEEIEQEIADIKNALFDFDTENAEEFCSQISQIEDKKQLLALKKALQTSKELYNALRLQGSHEFLEHLDFDKLNLLYRETVARLDTLIRLRRAVPTIRRWSAPM